MKKLINIVWTIIVLLSFQACFAQDNVGINENRIKLPEISRIEPVELCMDEDTFNTAVDKNSKATVDEAKEKHLAEGLAAIEATIAARDALKEENSEKALSYIETAVGKLEVLLARNPDLALIPVSTQVITEDFVGDVATIKSMKEEAVKAMEDGRFQLVRNHIAKLGSEVKIETTNIPTVSYPLALKESAAYMEEGADSLALESIQTMLNTLVITEKRIPLPIIRAEVLIQEALSKDISSVDNKESILKLLDNAEYQLVLAEELGYGKKDVEYEDLMDAVDEARSSVEDNEDSSGLLQKLKDKLRKFKHRVSG